MLLEEQIREDVRKWSLNYLEVPNVHLGGMPACPFAKKTWADKKVFFVIRTLIIRYRNFRM